MQVNSVSNFNFRSISPTVTTVDTVTTANNTSADNKVVPFRGFFSDIFVNKFNSKQEKVMYKELQNVLSPKDRANLEILYKTGKLSDKNSNDNTSTIENLYKIYKNPRIQGLDNKKLLSETMERLANPFIINQKFGIIPENVANTVLKEKVKTVNNEPNQPKSQNDMVVQNSASCVAASIEFSLADKKPAEFARFVAGLSSPEMKVVQNVKFENLNKNVMDALHLLKMFNVTPENSNWSSADITIAPDRDAIVRARVQNTYNDGKSRSSVDVLLQSAFMQLGSQNTYNSLTDKRYGALNSNDTGLTEFEKTFVESVVGNDGEKTSVVYQNVNDNSILEGYYYNPDVVKTHILNTLAQNKNVIIGITETDENKKIIGGHEMTIISSKMKNNELYFVCNDTDDDYVGAVEINANILIPKIHHAGIPVSVLGDVKEEDKGRELLKQYAANK